MRMAAARAAGDAAFCKQKPYGAAVLV